MDAPLLLVATTVAAYWLTVLILVVAKNLRHGRSAGLVPNQTFERRLWLLILPIVAAWIALPFLAGEEDLAGISLPTWANSVALVIGLRWVAALVALVCYLLSLKCWLTLGKQWSMAIVPDNTTQLVRTGLYRWVRHPIYSLSITLMLASVVVTLTVPMALVACMHLVAMNLKANHEERHLVELMGPVYEQYRREVGRFVPRLPA